MKKAFLVFFLLVSGGDLLANFTGSELLEWICKPMIMLSLAAFYISVERARGTIISHSMIWAMSFSFAGDVLLLFQPKGEIFFMLGLGAFLVAHISFIVVYRIHQKNDTISPLLGTQKVRFAFPIVLTGTGLISVLYAHLGSLKLPVVFYALVLMFMVLQALFRYGKTNKESFWNVFLGASLFMISDSMIAVNKFLVPIPSAGVVIMMTYILAQYLIVSGILKHSK